MLDSKEGDVKIIIHDGREFPCHSAILGLRSAVFKAMLLNSPTLEQQTRQIQLEDMVNSDVVEALLSWIYTDQHNYLDVEDTVELLKLANKYLLHSLETKCEKELAE